MKTFLFFLFSLLFFSNTYSNLSVAQVIGQSLWEDLSDKNDTYLDAFIAGMIQCENENILPLSQLEIDCLLDELKEIKFKLEAKKNQIAADNFFQNLSQKKEIIPLVHNKLYFRTIKPGSGKAIRGINDKIACRFKIRNIHNKIVKEGQAIENNVPLQDMIPGMIAGMIGMKEGEKREIFISPVFAYGDAAHFSPAMTLISEVELTQVCFQEEPPTKHQLHPLPLKNILEPLNSLGEKRQKLENKIAFQLGVKTWNHFKKAASNIYSLANVVNAIEQARKGNPVSISSSESQELLTHIHWDCYQASNT